MELQLQVTEEELLEFPEVRHDQINTSYTDKPAGKVVLCTETRTEENSTEKKSSCQNSSRTVEAVVQIHIPRLKLKNHTINNQ